MGDDNDRTVRDVANKKVSKGPIKSKLILNEEEFVFVATVSLAKTSTPPGNIQGTEANKLGHGLINRA